MGELANCPRCHALFTKVNRDLCPTCFKKEEADFRTVYDFIRRRENRQATVQQLVKATGVEEEIILKFVKEKRLRPSQFPNLSYDCERCGSPVVSGKLCVNCTDELISDLKSQEKIDTRNKVKEPKTSITYYTKNKS